MHSNSNLGNSLAAMTHLAASTPNLSYDCDTHYSWQEEEVIEGGNFRLRERSLAIPDGPGTWHLPRPIRAATPSQGLEGA